MTVIIVPINGNRYRYETIEGTVRGEEFMAVLRSEFLANLKAFRVDTLKGAFSWNTPTSSITAAFIAAKPQR